jgi:SAM-dependent methyltransferase
VPSLTKTDIYRDSASWYATATGFSSPTVIDYCRRKAGPRILDLGCATGAYCIELAKYGFACTGADTNAAYVDQARKRGVEAVAFRDRLPFPDQAFDTVILIEVLEHVVDVRKLLEEVKRVARRNVLLTVPCNEDLAALRQQRLTYEHMLELDHVNFFTKTSLARELESVFARVNVVAGDPIFPHRLLPGYLRKPLALGYRIGLFKSRIFSRLYAECRIADA